MYQNIIKPLYTPQYFNIDPNHRNNVLYGHPIIRGHSLEQIVNPSDNINYFANIDVNFLRNRQRQQQENNNNQEQIVEQMSPIQRNRPMMEQYQQILRQMKQINNMRNRISEENRASAVY